MNGEVAEGGTLRAGADDFEAGGLGGEAVEEFVLAASSHDVEAAETFAGDGGDVAQHFSITCGQASEDQCGELGSMAWCGIEFGEIAATKLRMNAVGHVSGEQQVGVVYIERVVVRGDGCGLVDEVGDGEGSMRGGAVPGFEALAQEPHAVYVFVEAEGVVDAAEVGEVFGTREWRVDGRGEDGADE